jgi:hypothetical protein
MPCVPLVGVEHELRVPKATSDWTVLARFSGEIAATREAMSPSEGEMLPEDPEDPEELPEDDAPPCDCEPLLHALHATKAPHASTQAIVARLARAVVALRVVMGLPPGASLRPGLATRTPAAREDCAGLSSPPCLGT